MIIILFDIRIAGISHLTENAMPQVAGKGKHVRFMHQRQLFSSVPFPCIFIGIPYTPFNHRTGIYHDLGGNFIWSAHLDGSSDTGINTPCVFTNHDKINVSRTFILQRRLYTGIQFDRTKVYILIQGKPHLQQYAHFEDSGFYIGVADGTEKNAIGLPDFLNY